MAAPTHTCLTAPVRGDRTSIFTHTRTNWVAAQDAITKLKEIAATDLGGSADDYEIGDERVYQSADPSIGLSYAQAAQRAMELGGKYSGQEYPDDINPLTQLAVQGLAGSGLIGVAKDNIPGQGQPPGVVVGFCEIEMDKDTGKVEILEHTAIADCGTVVHPKNCDKARRRGSGLGCGTDCSRASRLRSTEWPAGEYWLVPEQTTYVFGCKHEYEDGGRKYP